MSPAPQALATLMAQMPYAAFLGVTTTIDADRLILHVPFKPELIGNPFIPALHGGVLGSVLEVAAMAQLALTRESEKVCKPIDVQIEYLRSGKPIALYAAARVVRIGRRVAHVQAEAWQDAEEKPIAILHANYLVDEAAS